MKRYSNFFQTLHDEVSPVGKLGRGTHYSILRAVVWQNPNGSFTQEAKYQDIAVIWDEDHDTRVIEILEKMYLKGLLSPVIAVGERKGNLTVLVCDSLSKRPITWSSERYCQKIQAITDMVGGDTPFDSDYWQTVIGTRNNSIDIISAGYSETQIYLANINMLWELGVKDIKTPAEIKKVLPSL